MYLSLFVTLGLITTASVLFLLSVFRVVKEEISDESAKLPCFNGRVVSWVRTELGEVDCTPLSWTCKRPAGEGEPEGGIPESLETIFPGLSCKSPVPKSKQYG